MLFSEFPMASGTLANRIVMAPMTRSRTTQPGDVPNDLMANYYQQRASAGLIIAEGTPISAVARGYSLTPGIYSQQHIEGWKKTTTAVHKQGGKIFLQLWHVGRRSHTDIAGQQPVAPSAIKQPDQVYGPLADGSFGMVETSIPRAMTNEDIEQTTADFVQAARNAIEAGFDGVELHGAHGYLLDQFMRFVSNQRQDEYGGSQQNRLRFPLEVINAVNDAIGADKVAIRLSPLVGEGFKEVDSDIIEVTELLLKQLAPMKLAYVHFSENIGDYTEATDSFRQKIRDIYPNPIMVAGKLTQQSAQALLEKGYVDLVAFGTPYVTNPDLVQRFKQNMALTEFDADARLTLYGGDAEGYTDYAAHT
ncbi:alkene reductase [Shewanella electrodiphila]|uniref:Alkene reductase n=1 Tax=Shewanella electrodiphila TaxID=934143 RepID=A0ABT0KME6_9GAMM|nr:alkene reductase [Shewanella electrodiphila]MCL1044540.1 alkene reductase [Shewanella electrodiphila]